MIITRELINPDIIYKDYKKDDNFISFTYKDLIALKVTINKVGI